MPKQKQEGISENFTVHTPVLLKEVLDYLNPAAGESYLDVTAGYGGHAKAVLDRTNNPEDAILVDRDQEALNALEELFINSGAKIIYSDFHSASKKLAEEGKKFDLILADLGVSSLHLNEAKRGFAFNQSGPLDMRMDLSQDLTAEQIVNSWSGPAITHILRDYGEEPKAAQIARRIVAARPIKTTDELAKIVAKAWPGYSRVHPATRTFQALRIAVNNELSQLQESLPLWLKMLNLKGRLAVISFHSLEDRITKQFFKEHSLSGYEAELEVLTKKPVVATDDEIVSNPRSRSAKLRVAQRK